MDDSLFASLLTGLGGTIVGGLIEGVSDRTFCDVVDDFRQNLRLHQPDANHDIARAMYRSYLQATLQICAMRGESLGVNVEQCVLRESLERAITSMVEASPTLYFSKIKGQQILDSLKRLTGQGITQLQLTTSAADRIALEIRWLDKVATEIRSRIKALDRNKLPLPSFDIASQSELLVQPQYESAAEGTNAIRTQLIEQVLSEITAEFGQPPADEFVSLMKGESVNPATGNAAVHFDWFTLFCACFQHQLKHDDAAKAAFQNNILAQLRINGQGVTIEKAQAQLENIGGVLCQKLDDVRQEMLARMDQSHKLAQARFDELMPLIALTEDVHTTIQQLPEIIWQEAVKTRDTVERKGDEVIEKITEAVREEIRQNRELILRALSKRTSLSIKTPLVELPYDQRLIVDREDEIRYLLAELKNPNGLRVLPVIAPSGFGKTSFITKLLREVMDNSQKTITLPDVQAIVFVRCRERRGVPAILAAADQLTGSEEFQSLHRYAQITGENVKTLTRDFFSYLSQLGNVWIVLDNFESWLNAERQVIDGEVQQFFETALDQQHSVRLLLTSQFLPEPPSKHSRFKLNRLEKIDKGLDSGLPEADALKFLREEGRDCGLATADESLLLQFIRGVHHIPSAMESLIGYLSDDENNHRITFEQLMRDDELQAAFQSHDREAGGQYLIKKQLARLSAEELQALSAIVFFGIVTPRQALPGEEKQLTAILNRLQKNRLLRADCDPFGVTRYTVQPYIAQNDELQNISLPSDYAGKLIGLGIQAKENQNHRLARDLQGCAEKIYRTLIRQGSTEFLNDLAIAIMNKGVALIELNDLNGAIACFDEAIEIRHSLIEPARDEWLNELAGTVMNKGIALLKLNELSRSITCFDETIDIYRMLIRQGCDKLLSDLAMAVTNKGIALADLNDLNDLNGAIICFDEAIDIYRMLIAKGHSDLHKDLALSLMNKGTVLNELNERNKLIGAVICYDEAIYLYSFLIEKVYTDSSLTEKVYTELCEPLARTQMNKGITLAKLNRFNDAIILFDKAFVLYSSLVEKGRTELYGEIAKTLMNKGIALKELDKWSEAITFFDESIKIYRSLIEEGSFELRTDLAKALASKGLTLQKQENFAAAYQHLDEAVALVEECVHRDGQTQFAGILEKMTKMRDEVKEKIEN